MIISFNELHTCKCGGAYRCGYVPDYIVCTSTLIMYYTSQHLDPSNDRSWQSNHSKCNDPIVKAAYHQLVVKKARNIHTKIRLLSNLLSPDICRHTILYLLYLNEI